MLARETTTAAPRRFAAFAGGMQSGDPLMGGLQGALAGFATGNPISAVVGGIAGRFAALY